MEVPTPPNSWFHNPHRAFKLAIFAIFLLCIFMNLYVLFSSQDTIYYLRIYHLIVGGLMIASSVVRFLHCSSMCIFAFKNVALVHLESIFWVQEENKRDTS